MHSHNRKAQSARYNEGSMAVGHSKEKGDGQIKIAFVGTTKVDPKHSIRM